eukprot:353414-Chlamydomonas_euryale.AAC.10
MRPNPAQTHVSRLHQTLGTSFHAHLQAQHRRLERQRRAPCVLEDVEADCAGLAAHVGVPHLGDEAHLGRLKRVAVAQLDVHLALRNGA